MTDATARDVGLWVKATAASQHDAEGQIALGRLQTALGSTKPYGKVPRNKQDVLAAFAAWEERLGEGEGELVENLRLLVYGWIGEPA